MSTATTPWKATIVNRINFGTPSHALEVQFSRTSSQDTTTDHMAKVRKAFFASEEYRAYEQALNELMQLDDDLVSASRDAANAENRLLRGELTAEQAQAVSSRFAELQQARSEAYSAMQLAYKKLPKTWNRVAQESVAQARGAAMRKMQNGATLRALAEAAAPYLDELATAAEELSRADSDTLPSFGEIVPPPAVPIRSAV